MTSTLLIQSVLRRFFEPALLYMFGYVVMLSWSSASFAYTTTTARGISAAPLQSAACVSNCLGPLTRQGSQRAFASATACTHFWEFSWLLKYLLRCGACASAGAGAAGAAGAAATLLAFTCSSTTARSCSRYPVWRWCCLLKAVLSSSPTCFGFLSTSCDPPARRIKTVE
jgi:hypothetical protein